MKFSNKLIASTAALLLLASNVNSAEFSVDQVNKEFAVSELTVKVGDKVHFKNEDSFFHNVFSLSDIQTFDLGSYPKGEQKTVTFDTAGEVEIECAIHPDMRMVIKVEE